MLEMKNRVSIAIGLLVFLSACTSHFDALNIDPNNPTKVSSQSIMLQVQRSTARALLDDNNIFAILNWVQYTAPQGYQEQPYEFNWNTDATFNACAAALRDLEMLRKQAVADNHVNYEAIAMVMKVWVFANLTDLYGDVPYSEALKGVEGVLYPKYDAQRSIYADMVQSLKEAAAKMDVLQLTATVDGDSDIFCQGDMLKWKKFANSLRARLYLRMAESDDAQARAGLEEIFADSVAFPVISGNAQNVGIAFIAETDGPNSNYWVRRARSGTLSAVSTTVVDLLCKNDDPRRTVLLNPTKASLDSVAAGKWTEYVYRGIPPVINNPFTSFSINEVSTVGDAISLDYFRPIDILTYAEVLFIRAEAATKGYDVGNAKEDYEAGIAASMEKWGVSDPDRIDAYIHGPFAAYDAAKGAEQIVTQRYIEQFHQACNTFALIRRSGFPQLGWIGLGFALENGFPDRMPYAFNMRREPGFADVADQPTLNLWGNVWFAQETPTVHTAPGYKAPVIYQFADK